MEKFKQDLKNNQFNNLYFFLGEETFLSEYYAQKLMERLLEKDDEFNYVKLYPDELEDFQNIVEASPVMADKKMVYVKGRNFSEEINSDTLNLLSEILEDIPPYTYVLFLCREIDKKSKIYKLLCDKCKVCLFEHQKTDSLISWISKVCRSKKVEIDRDVCSFLLTYTGNDMITLMSELEKLSSYVGENGKITEKDISELVTKSVEGIVFDMIDEVFKGDFDKAFEIFNDLKIRKETPVAINGAISSCFIKILQYCIMKNEKASTPEINSSLMLKSSFMQRRYNNYSQKTGRKLAERMVEECSDFDIKFKKGEIDGYTGLNMILCEMMAGVKYKAGKK